MNDMPEENVSNSPIATTPRNNLATQMAGTQALVQRSLAEVQVAVMMAKQFPRDVISVKENLMIDCCRPELAEKAMYSYAKGGTNITGPSIRLAEAAERAWGNMQSGWRELSRTTVAGVGQSEIEAFCWDTETNTRSSVTFTVRHWRDTKQGGYALKEERDIYELCANQASRRKRACILQRIDGGIIADAIKQCETTMTTKVQATPERIASMAKMFLDEYGITQAQIEKRIQRRMEAINPPLMISLTKIYNSLKEGMSKAQDWFEPEVETEDEAEEAKTKTQKVKDKLNKQKKAEDAGADPQTGEIPSNAAKKEEVKVATPTVKNGEFSSKQIPLRGKPNAPMDNDYEAWCNIWCSIVGQAGSEDQLMTLHKSNQHLLTQMQSRDPAAFERCMGDFNAQRELLDDAGGTAE